MMDQTHTTYENPENADMTLIGQIPLPLPQPDPSPPTSQPERTEIHTVTVRDATVQDDTQTPSSASAHPGILRAFLRIFMGIMAMFALAVYSITLLSETGALLAGGIGHIAVGELFGGMDRVTVQSVTPPKETDDSPGQAESEMDTDNVLSSLPANEDKPETVPASGIRRYDLSSRSPMGLGLINETPYSPDLDTLLTRTPIPSLAELQKEHGTDAPVVLILHTHGTEAFADCGADGYHTAESERNITSIGALMADILESRGIPVLHCTTLFDEDSFDSAYYNASLYIKTVLRQYPSVSYIFDVHRDAITDGENNGVAPYTERDGIGYAQMMFVVGTDHGGSGHTGWLENLSLAVRLQAGLHGRFPTLMRDINLRSASFNAQYAKGALLIEAGAAASDREDVENAVRLLADVIADEIIAPGSSIE